MMNIFLRTIRIVCLAAALVVPLLQTAYAQQTAAPVMIYNDRRLHGGGIENVDEADLYKQLAERMVPKLSALYHTTLSFEEIPHVTPREIAAACDAKGASGAVILIIGTMAKGNFKMNAELHLTIAGRDGIRRFTATRSGGRSYSRFTFDVARDQLFEIADKLYDAAAAEALAQPQATANLVRYGIYMIDAQKDAFFRLDPSGDAAVVSSLWRQGTAARAGLLPGDIVTSVNGRATNGLSKAELDSLATTGTGAYVLSVRMTDGKLAAYRFEPQTAQWYAAHMRH
jgi:hypothetical protein